MELTKETLFKIIVPFGVGFIATNTIIYWNNKNYLIMNIAGLLVLGFVWHLQKKAAYNKLVNAH